MIVLRICIYQIPNLTGMIVKMSLDYDLAWTTARFCEGIFGRTNKWYKEKIMIKQLNTSCLI